MNQSWHALYEQALSYLTQALASASLDNGVLFDRVVIAKQIADDKVFQDSASFSECQDKLDDLFRDLRKRGCRMNRTELFEMYNVVPDRARWANGDLDDIFDEAMREFNSRRLASQKQLQSARGSSHGKRTLEVVELESKVDNLAKANKTAQDELAKREQELRVKAEENKRLVREADEAKRLAVEEAKRRAEAEHQAEQERQAKESIARKLQVVEHPVTLTHPRVSTTQRSNGTATIHASHGNGSGNGHAILAKDKPAKMQDVMAELVEFLEDFLDQHGKRLANATVVLKGINCLLKAAKAFTGKRENQPV